MQCVIIFANGELPDIEKVHSLFQGDEYIICADGGTRHALALGIRPDLIIGDLDSTEHEVVQAFRDAGVAIEQHPRDKNETDLELAIDHAARLTTRQIIIVAALGGRLDQTLANIALLSHVKHASRDIRLDDGVEEIFLCRNQVEIRGRSGDIISLIPWQGTVSGVQTKNLKWPLHKETLHPDKTRGVSNEMTSDVAAVSIGSGSLLVVHCRKS